MGFLDKMVKKVIMSKPAAKEEKQAPKADNKAESSGGTPDAQYGGLRQQEASGYSGSAGYGANSGFSGNAGYEQQSAPPKRVRRHKPKPTANHGDSWTEGEEKHLRVNYDKGMSIEELANLHGRTRDAIAHRLIKMGYTGIVTEKPHVY